MSKPIDTALSEEIDLLRETANSLLAFRYDRRSEEQWSKYWGCLDTLRDMDEAVYELFTIKRKPTRAECIGFLQILVSQQDAIHHLSKCVGLMNWRPVINDELQTVRDLRNRITSHSAWSDRSKDGGKSTSMINWVDIREGGFKAVIYREESDTNYPLYEDVDFKGFVRVNNCNLKLQVRKILQAMNKNENKLKENLQNLDWSFLDNKEDGYLREKLWSPWAHNNSKLWQARSHMEIFLKRLVQAKAFFEKNEIFEIDDYNLNALLAGALKLSNYLKNKSPNEDERLQYYVMLTGWVELWGEFDDSIVSFRKKIAINP